MLDLDAIPADVRFTPLRPHAATGIDRPQRVESASSPCRQDARIVRGWVWEIRLDLSAHGAHTSRTPLKLQSTRERRLDRAGRLQAQLTCCPFDGELDIMLDAMGGYAGPADDLRVLPSGHAQMQTRLPARSASVQC